MKNLSTRTDVGGLMRMTLARAPGAWLLALALLVAAGAAEARFEAVARAGDWTVFRDNTARPFDNFATPLVMGTYDAGGNGALVMQCRPDSAVYAPTHYQISGGFLFLNFTPGTQGLVSTPWRTSVALEVDSSEYHTPYVATLPFVSGFLLEKLATDTDALYDEAQTVVAVPVWTMRSMEPDMRRGQQLKARVYDFQGRRVELSFSMDGFATTLDALSAACERLNHRRPG